MSFDINNEDNEPQPFIRQESQPKRRGTQPASRTSGGGLGCALVGIVFVLVAVLIGIALLLPPFSLGERLFSPPYTQLNQQNTSTSVGGLTVALDPANAESGFGVRLKVISYEVFSGQTAPEPEDVTWITAARGALPQSLTPLSPIYLIEKQGTIPGAVLTIAVPQGAEVTLIDLYRYDLQTSRWQFVASHPSDDNKTLIANVKALPDRLAVFLPSRLVPVIGVAVDVGQDLKRDAAALANTIYPAGLQPAASGALQGVLPAGIEIGHSYGVVPVIRNFATPAAVDVATVTMLLQNSGLRAIHIERLVDFASSKTYQGLAIDYRRLPPEQRDNFTDFITTLAQKLHNANLTLTVVVPFPTQDGSNFNTGAYDWRSIGATADSVQIVFPLDPQALADKGLVSNVLQWAAGEVNRARLQAAISVLSVQETDGSFTSVSAGDALAPLGRVVVKPNTPIQPENPVEVGLTGYAAQFLPLDSSNTPGIKYFNPDGTLVGTMWLTTGAAISKRLERVATYNLAGVVALDLASPGAPNDAVNTLSGYKVNQPAVQPSALSLKWMVMSNGTLVSESTAIPGTPFIIKPKKESVVNAEVVGAQSTLGPVTINVLAPAAVPTQAAPPATLPATASP
ncbi:MAG: hypothetical protein ABI947_22535 [Chloroflexota bacterium]